MVKDGGRRIRVENSVKTVKTATLHVGLGCVRLVTSCAAHLRIFVNGEMLEWDEFQRCAKEIELLSASIDDGWHFVEEKDKPGYLEKRTVFRDPQNHELVIKGLYHVVYSLSYEVPVLYFNMWRQGASNPAHSFLPTPSLQDSRPHEAAQVTRRAWKLSGDMAQHGRPHGCPYGAHRVC
ncbi:uncharacterized protein LOC135390977 isoform X2 [Ornithodoros turicata]|uniref:uncharacterized protein LOC135390977 isoform X2 n=1 Tax=Ornithodoros turicata TaxID=34597 RepID=UPI00313947E3